ncbi:uncharacterized protein [Nicotiana sylvestris]|uniref:uncharacterized protein n=1 Tax=Nicotiana sylvestris TaxID=4096 RepID=UPI00388C53C1
MIQHLDKNYIDPIPVTIHNQSVYCAHVEEEADGKPSFHDIKEYLSKGEYPEHANHTQKRMLQRLSNHFFHSGGNLYKRTPDLVLLRCVNAKEAYKLLEDGHAGTCRPHMNGFILAKKILRAGYFWMAMETDCIQYVSKCFQCQVHADMIKVPLNELNATSSPWPFAAWGMDVIGLIEPAASNRHWFILVAIDYFTKWVEAASYKAVTKRVIANFVKDRIICRFEVPESIITDNAANLNSDMMKVIWYRTTVSTSIGATPYMLVYGIKVVIPTEVEITSLRIIQEAELSDAEWIRSRYEQLALIDGKRMDVVCHGQLYQNRMIRAFNKRVKPRQFAPGQLVLKKIFPYQDETKGKFSPNWQGLFGQLLRGSKNMGIVETNGVDFAAFHLSGSTKTWRRDYCLARPAGSAALYLGSVFSAISGEISSYHSEEELSEAV